MSHDAKYGATPNLAKKQEHYDECQHIGAFLEWLDNEGYKICELANTGYEDFFKPVKHSINKWLADYIGVDLDALEREQMGVLAILRQAHDDKEALVASPDDRGGTPDE